MMKLEKFTVSDTKSDELVEVKVDVLENSAEKSVPADPLLRKLELSGRHKKKVHQESDKQSEDSHTATSGSNASRASPRG